MNDEQIAHTLLLEAHRCVEQAAEEAVAKIGLQRQRPAPKDGDIDTEALLAYPPNKVLSPEEEQAVRSMKLSTIERSALEKLIADGCAAAFFHFFNLIDATGDPEVRPSRGTWLGAWLVARNDDQDRDMLHDGFFESYQEYEEATRRRERTR
jgi:hypothetical protein